MNNFIHRPYEKRFLLAMLIVAVLAYLFWTGSRYPALNEKAVMSGAIQLEDVLSFEAKFPITDDMTLLERIFWSTLNWINTNKKGMTFGVLFAAAFLTAGSYLKRKSFRGSYSNSLLGMAIGTPLGVCVNCTAPIARGMYTSGLRAETTLSAMIASPTLNIVVLTMLFSLMPVYMAFTKIAFSLLIILLAVPVICRFLPRTEIAPEEQVAMPWSLKERAPDAPETESLFAAVLGVIVAYFRNLWYIFKMTVPLMLLAGFLGTVVAIFLPGDALMSLSFSAAVLVLVVLAGVFLPVPIGFDVVMAGVLLTAGLDQGYVMALLFTLGSFSVYSYFIVVQSLGQRAGLLLAGTVALCGFVAGWGAQAYHEWRTDRALELLLQSENRHLPEPAPWGAAEAAGADPWTVSSADADRIAVTATPFAEASPAAATGFTRVEAWQNGIDKPLEFSFRDMWPPFWEGRSVASGDIDRDGDLDLVIASTEAGLYVYENDGSGQFSPVALDLGPLAEVPVFNAALADVDNDGWPDLFVATYGEGNYLWCNNGGGFGPAPAHRVPNREAAMLSMALSFSDADRDGDLDVALGNWAAGWYRRVPGEESRNRIIWNDAGAFSGEHFTDLPGIPGETLSILFSDLNDDGAPDLIVGNDFEVPDYVYYGDGQGDLRMITQSEGLIPHTTTTTMAVKTGDLTGDGRAEIYLAQISGRSSGVSKKLKMQPLERYCDGIQREADRAVCQKNMAIKRWYRSGNSFDPSYAGKCQAMTGRYQAECKAMLVKDLAIQRNDPSVCGLIPAGQTIPRQFCDTHFLPTRTPTAEEADAAHQQILRSNVLLHWTGSAYEDTAGPQGLEIGGWSWDTKLADFDNDGDLDMYVVNGTWVPNEVSPSNLFFENDGSGVFSEASAAFGLEDYLMTASATQFDMDNDGDLDVLTHPVNGPLALFRNNTQGMAIVFTLENHAGNYDGIGAKITIEDAQGRVQTRELQLGGGFMSFDAPEAHFGLGEARNVVRATVRWVDGSETVIDGPLQAGHRYRITRG
ncbi:FG-GAP-like repeat-containing protein [Salipiger abyssi]|uniref:FG-GAP-like repeat-containing protein n=1 Tax=Salipiger abyssi TaxID=1250539 RepID=UPI0040591BAD